MQLMRISLVLIFWMFIFSLASAPNILAATPVDCFMPTPTTLTFARLGIKCGGGVGTGSE